MAAPAPALTARQSLLLSNAVVALRCGALNDFSAWGSLLAGYGYVAHGVRKDDVEFALGLIRVAAGMGYTDVAMSNVVRSLRCMVTTILNTLGRPMQPPASLATSASKQSTGDAAPHAAEVRQYDMFPLLLQADAMRTLVHIRGVLSLTLQVQRVPVTSLGSTVCLDGAAAAATADPLLVAHETAAALLQLERRVASLDASSSEASAVRESLPGHTGSSRARSATAGAEVHPAAHASACSSSGVYSTRASGRGAQDAPPLVSAPAVCFEPSAWEVQPGNMLWLRRVCASFSSFLHRYSYLFGDFTWIALLDVHSRTCGARQDAPRERSQVVRTLSACLPALASVKVPSPHFTWHPHLGQPAATPAPPEAKAESQHCAKLSTATALASGVRSFCLAESTNLALHLADTPRLLHLADSLEALGNVQLQGSVLPAVPDPFWWVFMSRRYPRSLLPADLVRIHATATAMRPLYEVFTQAARFFRDALSDVLPAAETGGVSAFVDGMFPNASQPVRNACEPLAAASVAASKMNDVLAGDSPVFDEGPQPFWRSLLLEDGGTLAGSGMAAVASALPSGTCASIDDGRVGTWTAAVATARACWIQHMLRVAAQCTTVHLPAHVFANNIDVFVNHVMEHVGAATLPATVAHSSGAAQPAVGGAGLQSVADPRPWPHVSVTGRKRRAPGNA